MPGRGEAARMPLAPGTPRLYPTAGLLYRCWAVVPPVAAGCRREESAGGAVEAAMSDQTTQTMRNNMRRRTGGERLQELVGKGMGPRRVPERRSGGRRTGSAGGGAGLGLVAVGWWALGGGRWLDGWLVGGSVVVATFESWRPHMLMPSEEKESVDGRGWRDGCACSGSGGSSVRCYSCCACRSMAGAGYLRIDTTAYVYNISEVTSNLVAEEEPHGSSPHAG